MCRKKLMTKQKYYFFTCYQNSEGQGNTSIQEESFDTLLLEQIEKHRVRAVDHVPEEHNVEADNVAGEVDPEQDVPPRLVHLTLN
jgi:hypothetical protein